METHTICGNAGTTAKCEAVALSVPGDARCVSPDPSSRGCAWGTGAAHGLSLCTVCATAVQANLKRKVLNFSGQEKSADLFWTLIYIQVASLCLCEKAVVTFKKFFPSDSFFFF